MAFRDELQKLSVQIMDRKSHIHNEEATKQSLIIPFIQLLGFDVYSPQEVKPEYVADFANKKGEKVDYAVFLNGKPIIFIEAKSIAEHLENHNAQLSRYFNSTPDVKFGILTNGLKYKLFTDLDVMNVMDNAPFYELDLENIKDEDLKILPNFIKDSFETNAITQLAEELVYMSSLMKKLKSLFSNPSDDFIRFLVKDFSETKVTSAVLDKFRPIVKDAITTTIINMVNEGLNIATTKQLVIPDHEISGGIEPLKKTIMTSEEELKAFDVIRDILTNAGRDTSQINYKDTVSYFAIFKRNVNGWFIRLVFDKEPMFVMIRLPYNIAKDFEVDLNIQPMGSNESEIKVFLNTADDIIKLRDLIINSFDLIK